MQFAPGHDEVVRHVHSSKKGSNDEPGVVDPKFLKYGGEGLWKTMHTLMSRSWIEATIPKAFLNPKAAGKAQAAGRASGAGMGGLMRF